MRGRLKIPGLLFSALVLSFIALSPSFALPLEERVKEFTLANGMKVILLERRQFPTLSLTIRFRVGAVDENISLTGTAHLLEHMLFKGTKTLGTKNYPEEEKTLRVMDSIAQSLDGERLKGDKADPAYLRYLDKNLKDLQEEHRKWVIKDEIESLYARNGAVGFNAMTSADTTTYVVNLPANRLELWARIESDRILNPVLREFYSERDVVLEERRRSIESQPGRKLVENFLAASFLAHPYGRPVIGWPSDIASLERRATEQFFRGFYSPANTVLTVVGDVKPEEALAVIKRYFERIPPQAPAPPLRTKEPEQIGERRIQVWADAQAQLILGFHKPNPPHPDDAVFQVIARILSSGRTSRLYKRLVEEEKVAVEVSANNAFPGERYPNLFVFFAAPRHPHTTGELERIIFQEIERLREEPVPEQELAKVKNQIQADFLRRLDSNGQMAHWLSYGQSLFGDWRFSLQNLQTTQKVSAEEVQRVVRRYFSRKNCTIATLVNHFPGTLPPEEK